METLRIERKIDSTTLTIPELAGFVGQVVDIVVSPHSHDMPASTDRWKPLRDLADDPGDFDFESVERQRQLDQDEAEARPR